MERRELLPQVIKLKAPTQWKLTSSMRAAQVANPPGDTIAALATGPLAASCLWHRPTGTETPLVKTGDCQSGGVESAMMRVRVCSKI